MSKQASLPLETMAGKVSVKDLIKVEVNPPLGLNEYIGYVWWCPKEEGNTPVVARSELIRGIGQDFITLFTGENPDGDWESNNRKRFLGYIGNRLKGEDDCEIIIAGLNPHGNSEFLYKEIEFLGINLKTGTIGGNEKIVGYRIIEKYRK